MAKFGKTLRNSMVQEWQNEYFTYKQMKRMIKEFLIEINVTKNGENFMLKESSGNIDNENEITINTLGVHIPSPTYSVGSTPNIRSTLDNICQTSFGHLLRKFLDRMNQEIRKIYLFYCKLERELYLQINTLLHRRSNYVKLNLNEIYKELDNLVKVSHITKSFGLYINDNMMAIKKILKKFDRNFQNYYGIITTKFLKSLLEQPNSDFNYMLQFKIIDEVSALVDDMMKDLIKEFQLRKKIKNKKNKVNDTSSTVNDLLIADHQSESNSSIVLINNKGKEDKYLVMNIKAKINLLKNYTCEIDEISTFRAKIKDWNFYIRNGYSIINNHIKLLNPQSSMMVRNPEDDEVLKKFLTSSSVQSKDKQKEVILSIENRTNIIISLLHTYLFMTIYSVCLPSNTAYLDIIKSNGIYSGLILGLTPFGAIISALLFTKWSDHSYKYPLIVSLILLSIGSFLYAFAYNLASPVLIGTGRFIVGLGSARTVNRRYLIQFIPKSLIRKYSNYYVLAGILGLASGPAFTFIFMFLYNENDVFKFLSLNFYTYPGWFGFSMSFVLFMILVVFYREPYSNSFNMFENDNEPKNVITKEEKVMINEIDNKLDQINIENNFSDTNLIQSNIEKIKLEQKSSFSYIYKCFVIMFITLFSVRFCNESLLIILPYYLLENNYSMEFICLFMSGSLFLVVSTTFIVKKLSIKFPRERKILIYLLVMLFLVNIIIIDLIYESVVKFCICMVVMIILTNLIESLSSSLLSKIIPPGWELGLFNAGFLINISTTAGKSLGSIMLTISGLIFGKNYIIIATYGLSALIFFITIITYLTNYSDLRVKAVARILKNQIINKI